MAGGYPGSDRLGRPRLGCIESEVTRLLDEIDPRLAQLGLIRADATGHQEVDRADAAAAEPPVSLRRARLATVPRAKGDVAGVMAIAAFEHRAIEIQEDRAAPAAHRVANSVSRKRATSRASPSAKGTNE